LGKWERRILQKAQRRLIVALGLLSSQTTKHPSPLVRGGMFFLPAFLAD
jgi:hypothetical protein